ncbi:spermidine synthase [Streptomyces zagrosensis]|uniref:Polyamine aminopropyltransferase n=1 Tax=Streptomyces zagrosensis TaxID=1042984 RepID=A0A7W9Q597_9ACTN|nr:spermidine synthase [Streptomyces zagrosensis]MBB5933836.1 spermidine synthase [Streptomyces zagrosensis]
MIDPPVPLVSVAEESPPVPEGPPRLPVPAPVGRFAVLTAVFVCAACGLVYELELVALASYLLGDSVTQASVVLSVMVFAMGMGSLLAKRLRGRAALAFGAVESLLALIGGASAMALYACFAWYGESRSALVGFSLAIGVLIGAEVPLLMTLIQRIRRQDAGGAVADLFAADYVGALAGGLAFPFLLLPHLGQLTGALVTGAVNVIAGGTLVLWVFRHDLTVRGRWMLIATNGLVLLLLATGAVLTGPFERAARHAVYGPDVRVALRTDVQEVIITGGVPDVRGLDIAPDAAPETAPGAAPGAVPHAVPGAAAHTAPHAVSGAAPDAGGAGGTVAAAEAGAGGGRGGGGGGGDAVDGGAAGGGDGAGARKTWCDTRPVRGGGGGVRGGGGARGGAPLALFLDGRLRVSERDEYRYHEALVHPAMAGPHGRVLILGGGDGLALREVLRYPGVRAITVVELDEKIVDLARKDPGLSALNQHAYRDPRVRVVEADAFTWLRGRGRSDGTTQSGAERKSPSGSGNRGRAGGSGAGIEGGGFSGYDVVLSDLPGPGSTASTKLYSQEFYGLAERVMRPGGRLAVHAGGPAARSLAYWSVDATVRSVGLHTMPYRITGRLAAPDHASHSTGPPGDWGFVLARRGPADLRLPTARPVLRSLTPDTLSAAGRATQALRRAGAPVSTLMHPRYASGDG